MLVIFTLFVLIIYKYFWEYATILINYLDYYLETKYCIIFGKNLT